MDPNLMRMVEVAMTGGAGPAPNAPQPTAAPTPSAMPPQTMADPAAGAPAAYITLARCHAALSG